jgi:outer membrane protein OmpA-like peptidoglycan-associated protein
MDRPARKKRAIVTGVAAAALVFAIGFAWMSVRHGRDLERRLDKAAREAEALALKAREYAQDRDQALQLASSAHQTAEQAGRAALEALEARSSAEERTREAEESKKRADEESRLSRLELADLRERREQELTRMHEALARIAKTERTSSGLTINLANDSFHFDFDQAALRPENREILSRIAGVLLVSNGYRLYVHGHTDDVGDAAYNVQLSERRAASVANYLKAAGIRPEVIETKGFGQSSPRVAARTPEARRTNRRVEIVIVDSLIQYERIVPSASR